MHCHSCVGDREFLHAQNTSTGGPGGGSVTGVTPWVGREGGSVTGAPLGVGQEGIV